MVCCAVVNCKNRNTNKNQQQVDREKDQGCVFTFHLFPKNPVRKALWGSALGKPDWTPTARSALCSVHFEEKYFDRTSLRYVRLREDAVPTLFPEFSEHIQKSNLEEPSTNTTEELSQIHESEISLHEIKVEKNDIFMETLPIINIKQEENSDEELHLSNTKSYNNVNQPEFTATDANISSQHISSINKQTNNVLTFTNVNPIITHKGCSVFMVTAHKDTPQTTSKVISSNELSTINTEVYIKEEIHEQEQDKTLYDNTIDFTEESMIPVTQNERFTPVQTNTSTTILKNVLKTTLNKETLDNNSKPDQAMIESRGNTMSTEGCTTTADKPEWENENFVVEMLKNTLEKERREHRNKVRGLQKIIQRLRKANEKLKETVKELKLENSLYS